jgi:hypothetical protein
LNQNHKIWAIDCTIDCKAIIWTKTTLKKTKSANKIGTNFFFLNSLYLIEKKKKKKFRLKSSPQIQKTPPKFKKRFLINFRTPFPSLLFFFLFLKKLNFRPSDEVSSLHIFFRYPNLIIYIIYLLLYNYLY